MSVVAIVSMKGGVGKTTTAAYLTRSFALREPDSKPLLLDPTFGRDCEGYDLPGCEIVFTKHKEIPAIIAENPSRQIVIDCGRDFERVQGILGFADLIVIPIVPGGLEFSATKQTLEWLKVIRPDVPVRVAITMLPNRNQYIREMRRMFGSLLFNSRISWCESVCMAEKSDSATFDPVYASRSDFIKKLMTPDLTTFDFAPDSLPSQQYAQLGDEIIEALNQRFPVAA